jgi:hypothetical protein
MNGGIRHKMEDVFCYFVYIGRAEVPPDQEHMLAQTGCCSVQSVPSASHINPCYHRVVSGDDGKLLNSSLQYRHTKEEVNQSLYRYGQTLRFPKF